MTRSYYISAINDIQSVPVLSSRFFKAIADVHRPFFGGLSILPPQENRQILEPHIGSTIKEHDLANRWRRYDEEYRAEDRISRFWVTDISEATVWPPFGIVGVKDHLVRDTIRNGDMISSIFPECDLNDIRTAMLEPGRAIASPAVRPARRIPGHSFLLGFGVYENYFNWTLRYASRIGLFQALSSVDQLVVPELRKRYVGETLEFFGVSQEKVVALNAPTVFERLTLVSPVAYGRYEISPLITQTLREHRRVKGLWRKPKRRLYIPRRNVSMRVVVNESEVEKALRELGFEIFDNSEHSIGEQIRAFRDSEIVVAPHGAGLSNIVYCDIDTPIIEIVPEGYDQGVTSYRSLSDLFKLRYFQLFAREAKVDRKGNRCNSDIEIDVADLVVCLQRLGI